MDRQVASLPDSIDELCLIRLGLVVRRLRAWPYALRLGRAIRESAAAALGEGAGLLGSEMALMPPNHLIVLQYWSSFGAMEAWSHRPPHSTWWKGAVERMRTKGDFGIYHESYLVPRSGVESIYVDVPPGIGLAKFGTMGPAEGSMTTSRDRLGRRPGRI